MTPQGRAKLLAVLARLAADHVGERAAAGLLACRLLDAAGLRWGDVIAGGDAEQPARPHPWQSPQQSFRDWRAEAGFAARHLAPLSDWQRDFLHNLSARRDPPSPRQLEILGNLFARATARAAKSGSAAA